MSGKRAAPRAARPHRARRARSLGRSGKIRAVLSLGLVLGLGQVGTMAYWTDQATLNAGTISAGNLDIGLNGLLTGPGGATTVDLAVTALTPGESIARIVTVNNHGTAPLTYTATGTASGDLATLGSVGAASRLQFQVHTSGVADNTGTQAGGDRSGTCSGTQRFSGPLGATPATVIGVDQSIAAGGTQSICVRIALPATAPNALQGTTATASFVFNAKQVGAP